MTPSDPRSRQFPEDVGTFGFNESDGAERFLSPVGPEDQPSKIVVLSGELRSVPDPLSTRRIDALLPSPHN